MPGLPLQPDELEDVGEPEVLDRSFEGHGLRCRPRARGAAAPRRTGTRTSKLGLARGWRRRRGDEEHERRQRRGPRGSAESAAGASVTGSTRPASRPQAITSAQTRLKARPRSGASARRRWPAPGDEQGEDAEDPVAPLLLRLHLEQLLVARGPRHAVAHHEEVVALACTAPPPPRRGGSAGRRACRTSGSAW